MNNCNILFYNKSFSKINIVIYLAFTWCVITSISIVLYVSKIYLMAWLFIAISIILLILLLLLCKSSSQAITLYNDRIELDMPKYDSFMKMDRIINIIPLSNLSNISITDAKRGCIIIEFDSNRIELKFISQAADLIRRVNEIATSK